MMQRISSSVARLPRLLVLLTLTVTAALTVALGLTSLTWRYQHDAPIMIYASWLVAGGSVPYRDFFDMNVPGTYLVLGLVGRLAGWNDAAFRTFDVAALLVVAGATVVWMRRFGGTAAVGAAIGFPLWYLNQGPQISLQREYLALVPLTLAYATCSVGSGRGAVRPVIAGLFAGAAILVKPQFAAVALPALLLLPPGGLTWRRFALFSGSAAVPAVLALGWLTSTGALTPFLEIARNYWPLYTHMTGDFQPISGIGRGLYILKSTVDGLSLFITPLAILGVLSAVDRATDRRSIAAMTALLGTTALYPAIAGQFWVYHWIPFQYAAICAVALGLQPLREAASQWRAAMPTLLVLFLFAGQAITAADRVRGAWLSGGRVAPPKNGMPDEIAAFLRERLQPGDTVQPLDWTAGAVHGMLMARARLATRFLYDFHFYHHVNSPYIQRLRREFVAELADASPRLVIEVTTEDKPWPRGRETSRAFPELRALLDQRYTPVLERPSYRILERRGASGTAFAHPSKPFSAVGALSRNHRTAGPSAMRAPGD